MGKKKDSKNTCGRCGVPCQCTSKGPKNPDCECIPPEPEPPKPKEPCECGCSPSQPVPKLPKGACTCGCSSPQYQPEPRQVSEDCECDTSPPQPQPQPKRQSGACACRYSPLQTEPMGQWEDCACDSSPLQPQPQPLPMPMQQSGCVCRYSPLQTEPTGECEDCTCDSSPPQPLLKPKRQSGACPPQSQPKPKRQSGASACGYSPLETEPTWQCNNSPEQPQEPIRIPCSPQIKPAAQPIVLCQCNQSGQSQPQRQSGAYECGSSAPDKSWQNSGGQALDYCQCNQPVKKETVETYVCYQPRAQPEEQRKCLCNAPESTPYPEPKNSYGLASIKSSPEPISSVQQEPKISHQEPKISHQESNKSHQVPKKSHQAQPNHGKEKKKKKCTIQ